MLADAFSAYTSSFSFPFLSQITVLPINMTL